MYIIIGVVITQQKHRKISISLLPTTANIKFISEETLSKFQKPMIPTIKCIEILIASVKKVQRTLTVIEIESGDDHHCEGRLTDAWGSRFFVWVRDFVA